MCDITHLYMWIKCPHRTLSYVWIHIVMQPYLIHTYEWAVSHICNSICVTHMWCNSFIMCDTYGVPYVWYNSFICVDKMWLHDSYTHVVYAYDSAYLKIFIWLFFWHNFSHVYSVTHSYVWHDSSMCVIWLIHACGMTHPYVWYDSFMCVPWNIRICSTTYPCMLYMGWLRLVGSLKL